MATAFWGGSPRGVHSSHRGNPHRETLSLEPPVDEHYAGIRNRLERAGRSIGPNDLLIAAHARALGLTLVTDNMREFSRVSRLAVENWLSADV